MRDYLHYYVHAKLKQDHSFLLKFTYFTQLSGNDQRSHEDLLSPMHAGR